MMRRIVLLSLLLLVSAGSVLAQSKPPYPATGRKTTLERGTRAIVKVVNGRATIDYAVGVLRATGVGFRPLNTTSDAQATVMAFSAAHADALKNLASAISAVQVTATTTVKNRQLESEEIRTRISALLDAPQVVSERVRPDGAAEVTVEMRLYGKKSVAEAILGTTPPETNVVEIIYLDCRGMPTRPVLQPQVKDTQGRTLDRPVRYAGLEKISPEFRLVRPIRMEDGVNPILNPADAELLTRKTACRLVLLTGSL